MQPTHRPHTSSFTPLNGGDFFCTGSLTGAGVNLKRRPLLLSLLPHWREYYFFCSGRLLNLVNILLYSLN